MRNEERRDRFTRIKNECDRVSSNLHFLHEIGRPPAPSEALEVHRAFQALGVFNGEAEIQVLDRLGKVAAEKRINECFAFYGTKMDGYDRLLDLLDECDG